MRGWHTYWRYPGDAGVPPQFNFAGSRNVKHVDVLWPAPERKVDSGGTSIGYSTGVLFPLRIVPQEAGKPVALRLRLQYAICEKLCVPAEARSELTLASGRASQDAALTAAEGRVPKRLNLGEGGDLAIRSVRRERGRRQQGTRGGRCRRTRRRRSVRGRPEPAMGPAGADAGRGRAARTAALCVRPRRRAHRRELPGRAC